MTKINALLAFGFSTLVSVAAFAGGTLQSPQDINLNQGSGAGRWGLQAAVTTQGPSAGITRYGRHYSAGIFGSVEWNNFSSQTQTYFLGAFGGGRALLSPGLYFAYGLDLGTLFGKVGGISISSSFTIAPYISIEYDLTNDLLLSLWTNPYSYTREKKCGMVFTTQRIFSTGVALSYLLPA
jgi:hypothetical protein